MNDERWLEQLADAADFDTATAERAPARLKSQIYSALVSKQSETGPLLSLAATKAAGSGLCVFEQGHRVAAARRTDWVDESVSHLSRARAGGTRRPCSDLLASLSLRGVPPLARIAARNAGGLNQKRLTNPNRF